MKSAKYYIKFFLCILLSVLLTSCTEKTDSVTTISFNPKAKKRSVFKTGLIKSIRLVKLESDSCIIGEISKIISHDSLLYVLDRSIAKEVFIFTKNGRFVNKISRQGHGKYEYTQLWDIFFDKDKEELCLLSRYDQKIISFTPDGKKVLGESKLPKAFCYMLPINDGYIGYMQNNAQNPSMPYNIWTMDKFFNLQEGFLRINPQLESSIHFDVNSLSAFGNTVYFKPEYDNNIYQIKDGKISLRYILDFGEKTFPGLLTVSLDKEEEISRLMMETIPNVFNYEETDDYLLMDFIMDGEHCIGIYNKQTHTSEIARLDCYEDEYGFPFGKIKGLGQTSIYSVIDYEDVYELWLGHNKYVNFEEEYPEQVNNLRKLFPKLEEDGNPFIAIYSL